MCARSAELVALLETRDGQLAVHEARSLLLRHIRHANNLIEAKVRPKHHNHCIEK